MPLRLEDEVVAQYVIFVCGMMRGAASDITRLFNEQDWSSGRCRALFEILDRQLDRVLARSNELHAELTDSWALDEYIEAVEYCLGELGPVIQAYNVDRNNSAVDFARALQNVRTAIGTSMTTLTQLEQQCEFLLLSEPNPKSANKVSDHGVQTPTIQEFSSRGLQGPSIKMVDEGGRWSFRHADGFQLGVLTEKNGSLAAGLCTSDLVNLFARQDQLWRNFALYLVVSNILLLSILSA